jgi:carbon-monoxide dehydrogenase medium subunit
MNQMRFEAPKTVDAAVALLAGAGGVAKVLAGGSDILIQMRGGRVEPELLVDVKGIAEMSGITNDNGVWRVGAAAPCMAIVEHKGFSAAWPGVTEAVALIGSIQIKGRATVGGNLCNASPAADSIPALIAAGATVTIVGPGGKREAKVEDICTGVGTNSLAKGEIVTQLSFPAKAANSGDAYLRFTPRTEMDIAVVGAGVNLTLDAKGVCTAARVALGAVAIKPFLVPEAAAALIGTTVDEAAIAKMGAACSAAAKPISDKRGTAEYRTKVSGVMAKRAAAIALARAKGSK